MKKTIFAALLMAFSLTGCYDDKGGNDFDSIMEDVIISIPSSAYSGALNSKITITPVIETNIPESDLQYVWEAKGNIKNENGRNTFIPLVSEEAQKKVLEYTCHLDSNLVALNTSYECRLRVRQKSTGRDFYSSSTFTITIAGVTGLMVLHGDGTSSDIGILEAEEFMPKKIGIEGLVPKASPDVFSASNEGKKLKGAGIDIVQLHPQNLLAKKTTYNIMAHTTDGYTVVGFNDFVEKGDWMYNFYLSDDRRVNANQPKGMCVVGDNMVAFDGEELYLTTIYNPGQFLFAEAGPTTPCGDGNILCFEPFIQYVATSGVQYVGYTSKVNGVPQDGFVAFNQLRSGGTLPYTSLFDTKDDKVEFNPGNMNAKMVKMTLNGNAHIMAVLKGNPSHGSFANQYFAVDLFPNAPSEGASSGFAGVPQYLYDLGTLTDMANAKWFEFGSTKTMCYYATSSSVYQYSVDGSTLYPAEKL
ncbi:MAG: PKD-like family lipoprotein, partial [Prevotella sp.]